MCFARSQTILNQVFSLVKRVLPGCLPIKMAFRMDLVNKVAGPLMRTETSIVDILEGFGLYGSYRAASKHVRCSLNTVKKFVLARDAGDPLTKRAI